ncbi:MAG TPA: lysylphosphatidylglycerol synthase transmembrane domain-containing protein [Chloroflexia bacterium]|nr:lysylphosphatidylglycerol synthase transmembrane domain-containing protein [Chloroflexia bacterium]
MKSLPATTASLLQSQRVRRLLQVATVALVLGFFAFAVYGLGPDLLKHQWQFDPLWLVAAFVLLFVRGPIGAYGWWAIARQLGYTLPWWRSVRIVYYSTLTGYIPGPMLHAVSRIYLAEKEGVPRLVTAVSVGMESVLVVLGGGIVASLSLIGWRSPEAFWVGGALLATILFLLVRPNDLFKLMDWVLVRLKRQPLDIHLSSLDLLKLLWPYTLNWLLFGLISFTLVATLYPTISLTQVPLITGLFTASWLTGYLTPFLPQGIGVREAFLISTLPALVGIPLPVATAAALLSRAWSMLGIALWGAISTRL